MTIASNDTKTRLLGDGSITTFDYDFYCKNLDHLKVVIADTDDVQTVLVLDTDFTVSQDSDYVGGTITYTGGGTPLPDGHSLTAYRELPVLQSTNFKNQGGFHAERHEDAMDKLVMMLQQISEELERCLKVTITSGETGSALDEDFGAILTACQAARDAAVVAQSAAETAGSGAGTSETNAGTSAGEASTSATAAANSASAAAASALAALANAEVEYSFPAGVPDNGDGNDGDMAINTLTQDVYHKESGVWVLKTNIKGDDGAAGAGTGDMLAANNLSDLADKAASRNTLSLKGLALFDAGSDFATSGATTMALAASGVTADAYGLPAVMNVDAKGRVTSVREAIVSDLPDDAIEIQDEWVVPATPFSTATVDSTDLIETGLDYEQVWDLGPATLVGVDGRVKVADSGATGPNVYLAISGASAFVSPLTLTETEAAASISAGAAVISTGQRVSMLTGFKGSNADAEVPHLRALWRLS